MTKSLDFLDVIYNASSEKKFGLFEMMLNEYLSFFPEVGKLDAIIKICKKYQFGERFDSAFPSRAYDANFWVCFFSTSSLACCIKDSKSAIKFIKNLHHRILWNSICQWLYSLIENHLEELVDYIDWNEFFVLSKFPMDFLERHLDKINLKLFSRFRPLGVDLLRKHKHEVDWDGVSAVSKLNSNMIDEFADFVNWHNISTFQKLSESTMRKYADKLDWLEISWNEKITQKVKRKFHDRLSNIPEMIFQNGEKS